MAVPGKSYRKRGGQCEEAARQKGRFCFMGQLRSCNFGANKRKVEEQVVLVDQNDNPIGTMGKEAAHASPVLHRAFSVFVFHPETGDVLLQQRAQGKYHSPGLWTNTCCSHPRPGEEVAQAAGRRLMEEMGFHTPLQYGFTFLYQAEFENGLYEHEYDHVLYGIWRGTPKPDPAEVQDWKFLSMPALVESVRKAPKLYTKWLQLLVSEREGRLERMWRQALGGP